MIDFESAKLLVDNELNEISRNNGTECMIYGIKGDIESGWEFTYNTAEFLKNKNLTYALAGNLPLFVSKEGVLSYISSKDENN